MKGTWVLFLGLVFFVAAGILFASRTAPANSEKGIVKWEYKVVDIAELLQDDINNATLEKVLNKLGAEGWELMWAQNGGFYFKRSK